MIAIIGQSIHGIAWCQASVADQVGSVNLTPPSSPEQDKRTDRTGQRGARSGQIAGGQRPRDQPWRTTPAGTPRFRPTTLLHGLHLPVVGAVGLGSWLRPLLLPARKLIRSGARDRWYRAAPRTTDPSIISAAPYVAVAPDTVSGDRCEERQSAARQTAGWAALGLGLAVVAAALGRGWPGQRFGRGATPSTPGRPADAGAVNQRAWRRVDGCDSQILVGTQLAAEVGQLLEASGQARTLKDDARWMGCC